MIRIVVGLSYGQRSCATGRSRESLWLQAAWLVVLIPAIIAGTHLAGITGTAIAQLVVGVAFVGFDLPLGAATASG